MINRATKLRWRRRVKRSQQHVGNLGEQAEERLDKHFFKRLNRFIGIRRFVFSWILLFVLIGSGIVAQMRALSPFYQLLRSGQGGIYTEGIVGTFTNANPIYSTSAVDASAARLVFSSLMKYDADNNLVGDLSKKMTVNKSGTIYTVALRTNATWHDGEPLTADDVVFTYKTIQKADAKSPLLPNWQKVDIKAKDKYTVEFTLPHGLASFPHSLTNGIIPKHVLDHIPPAELRSASFNTVKPIGSGPFRWEAIQVVGNTPADREEQIGLIANNEYYKGPPKLERFVIRAFHDDQALEEALEDGEVSGASGLNTIPDSVEKSPVAREYSIPVTGEVMVFFKSSHNLLKYKAIRRALTHATNQNEIIAQLGYPVALAKGPLLVRHVGYDKNVTQYGNDVAKANTMLEKEGWKLGSDGIRRKGDQTLSFELLSQSDSQYGLVAQVLQQQWRKIGVDLKVTLRPDAELQTTIASHGYDALLYGITIGPDPDVYAYWHSSQADPRSSNRLNLAEFKSDAADVSLEVGRSRFEDKLRATKYKPFLEAWRSGAPAIALYQPRYLYITSNTLYGFEPKVINTSVDRYSNIENWAVRQDRVNIY